MPEPLPEPWLRGVIPGLNPVTGHLLRASEQIREDLARHIAPLTPEQLWARPEQMTPAGFHVKHLAGSTERLCQYLVGRPLSDEQIRALERESQPEGNASELLERVNGALSRFDEIVRQLRADEFGDIREVGRKRIPVTAIGLAIHIVEHGQRHVGQAISAAKLSRASHGG